ncbi:TRAP transporter small permease subunit [Spongiibacter sp. KMU-158]|uniref:TRAP transporter small permease protein n=2 Tax=Spongiibacter pelagi TaxID=2760804 RepID=A0A927GVR2_9GAMM|nr:TRAP transporter small permease subunit [Spongiibacter pelagi]
MVLITASVVVLRYGFDLGFTALQESITYLHATLFMLGTAFTLKHDRHVRVDIFYQNFSPRKQAWIDAVGAIVFLLPLCGLILLSSWQFTLNAWAIRESSVEPGGIPAVFLLKTLVPVMAVNLALQAVAEVVRNLQVLMGDSEAVTHEHNGGGL